MVSLVTNNIKTATIKMVSHIKTIRNCFPTTTTTTTPTTPPPTLVPPPPCVWLLEGVWLVTPPPRVWLQTLVWLVPLSLMSGY